MTGLRPRLTYPNVVSALASSSCWAAGRRRGHELRAAGRAIRGCVSKTGQLTVLKKGNAKCKKGQTKIAWNQVGKTGAPGQQGAKGDTGPPGPATGPAGHPSDTCEVSGTATRAG